MQIEKKDDIVYFAVDGLSRWEFEETKKFLDKRIGAEITLHVGHKEGHCMCFSRNQSFARPTRFGIEMIDFPCFFPQVKVESVQEVEKIDKYEGSVDFTIGAQFKNEFKPKTLIVGIKMKNQMKEYVEYYTEKDSLLVQLERLTQRLII